MNTLLIIVIFLLVPVYIIECLVIIEDWRKRSTRKTLVNAITRFSNENDLQITEFEFFRNKVIGIDRMNRKLVFADYRKAAIKQFCIDLDKYSICSVKRIDNEYIIGVKEVFLEMKCKKSNQSFKLKFFERYIDDIRATGSLLNIAKRWKGKIDLCKNKMILNY
jgi:hypothetical protein